MRAGASCARPAHRLSLRRRRALRVRGSTRGWRRDPPLPLRREPSAERHATRLLSWACRHPSLLCRMPVQVRCVESDRSVTLVVERRRGHNGEVCVQYDTKPREALEGIDYIGAHGTLTFAHGQLSASLTIEIVDDTSYEKDETFLCVLSAPTNGALFREDTDGRAESDICTITIESDNGVRTKIDRVLELLCGAYSRFERPRSTVPPDTRSLVGASRAIAEPLWCLRGALSEVGPETAVAPTLACVCHPRGVRRAVDRQRAAMVSSLWAEQIRDALWLGDEDERSRPSAWLVHTIMLPWKLIFALIGPPPELWGGVGLFLGALAGIAGQVILIGDVAGQLGCLVGLRDSVTAITFVALGTSLPDLFASMHAAREDSTADNSVGNVTGSNSVNVFMGLGLPWLMAAIYWHAVGATDEWKAAYPYTAAHLHPGGGFVVCAGSLAFGVTGERPASVIVKAPVMPRVPCVRPRAHCLVMLCTHTRYCLGARACLRSVHGAGLANHRPHSRAPLGPLATCGAWRQQVHRPRVRSADAELLRRLPCALHLACGGDGRLVQQFPLIVHLQPRLRGCVSRHARAMSPAAQSLRGRTWTWTWTS